MIWLWLVLAAIGVAAVVFDVGGAVSANAHGRGYSFGSAVVLPPLLVVLGLISLLGNGDSWVFNPVLGFVLLAVGVALLTWAAVLIKRAVRPPPPN